MIITQTFWKDKEVECGDELIDSLPVPTDEALQRDLMDVLEVVQANIEYQRYFTLRVDTDRRAVKVVEVR